MNKKIEGVLTAIITPFDKNGNYNEDEMRKQIKRQLKFGNGIFCGGTNGEFFVLKEKEKIEVTETCVDEVSGKANVVAHIGEISTRDTINLGRKISHLGVDAVSVITPYFIPLTQNELISHFSEVADALEKPIFLYNIPARTGNTLTPETVRILARHPNIIGIKDSAGSYESLSSFLKSVEDISDFDVLNGPDSLIHQGFIDGCSACISGLANIVPKEINDIWSYFNSGNISASRDAQENVTELRTELYKIAFSPASVKKALQISGQDVGDSRYAVNFNESDIKKIKEILVKYI